MEDTREIQRAKLLYWRNRIEDCLPYPPPEVELDFRHMFGGMGAYVRGKIFAILFGDEIALKFDRRTQDALLEEAPDAQHVSWTKLYFVLPTRIAEDDSTLGEWMRLSIDDVLNAPPRNGKFQ